MGIITVLRLRVVKRIRTINIKYLGHAGMSDAQARVADDVHTNVHRRQAMATAAGCHQRSPILPDLLVFQKRFEI